MTTTTARIEHPTAIKGRARAYWAASHATRLVLNLAFLAGLAWAVSRPTVEALPPMDYLLVAAGAMLAGRWVARRLGWLAWAEVPGAWRVFTTDEEAAAAAPDRSADRWIAALHNGLTAAAGVYIAHLPGQAPRVVVGCLGGVMAAVWAMHLGRALAGGRFERSRTAFLGLLIDAAPRHHLGQRRRVRMGDHRRRSHSAIPGVRPGAAQRWSAHRPMTS